MTDKETVEIIRRELNSQLYDINILKLRDYSDPRVIKRRLAYLHAIKALKKNMEKNVLYLCKYHKEPHYCKHTSRLEDALNFKEIAKGKYVEVEHD